jgi:flagellar hook-basal body complex protein FliE
MSEAEGQSIDDLVQRQAEFNKLWSQRQAERMGMGKEAGFERLKDAMAALPQEFEKVNQDSRDAVAYALHQDSKDYWQDQAITLEQQLARLVTENGLLRDGLKQAQESAISLKMMQDEVDRVLRAYVEEQGINYSGNPAATVSRLVRELRVQAMKAAQYYDRIAFMRRKLERIRDTVSEAYYQEGTG